MKIAFYIKLFIAFIIFAIILLGLFFVMSKSFYKEHYTKLSSKTFKEFINYKKNDFENSLQLNDKKIMTLAHSNAFRQYRNENDDEALIDFFKTTMYLNDTILELKILDSTFKESLVIKRNNQTIKVKRRGIKDLSDSEMYQLLSLQENQLWRSKIHLNYTNGQIEYPVRSVLKFAIKKSNNYIVLVIDADAFFGKSFKIKSYQTYIIDQEGNFIIHKNPEYNWSSYFHPKVTVQSEFPKSQHSILTQNSVSTSKFISSQIKISKDEFIIVLIEFDDEVIKDFADSTYVVAIITVIISIILAMLFSNPIANLNKKLEAEKDKLNLSVIKSGDLLDDSLKLIDKYVMYIKFDKDKTIIDVSSFFCDISGFVKEELLGKSYEYTLHKDNNFDEIFSVINKSKPYTGNLKKIKKFSEEYWVESNFEPNYDENREIVSFTEISHNITYRKKIKNLYDDLHNQIEQLNAIFHNANSGIVLLDYHANIKKVNMAFCNLLGFTNNEVVSKNIFSLVLESRKEFFNLMLSQAKEYGSMSNIEIVLISKNKERIFLNISFSLLPDKEHIVLVSNSLEDKRKLQELNQTLAHKVKVEVEKNTEQQRIHQVEQIKNAKLTSIGTLAAGITHEINTPLTYLKGNFEMMQYDIDALPNGKEKSNMLQDAEKITEAIDRIENIVEAMREVAQVSSEKKERTNIYSTIVTSVTMAYNISKHISKIYINNQLFDINHINKNREEFFSNVQKQRVGQVWLIIINNALDALKKIDDYEQREFHINLFVENNDLVIMFKDNAGGIEQSILKTIFDPFVSTKEHSGMGVGLNIAKKIVDEQGGLIKAYNENSGAIFEIRFNSVG